MNNINKFVPSIGVMEAMNAINSIKQNLDQTVQEKIEAVTARTPKVKIYRFKKNGMTFAAVGTSLATLPEDLPAKREKIPYEHEKLSEEDEGNYLCGIRSDGVFLNRVFKGNLQRLTH
jgi:hypothetical protein